MDAYDNNEGLDIFKQPEKVNTTPLLKDLYEYITPRYAADWKVIGTLLDLPSGELKAIEAGYPTNVRWCCNEMLEKWLEIDTTASWGKLFTVVESPAMRSCSAPPDKAILLTSKLNQLTITDNRAEAVAILSNRVRQINVHTRFIVDDNTWPPEQPTSFTPLLLIHHQGHRTPDQVKAMAELTCTGDIGNIPLVISGCPAVKGTGHEKFHKVFDMSKATKEIEEILAPLENSKEASFILIEGAPGIGKSVLLKEIAFRWGRRQLLQNFELVLLVCLRDPSLQQIESVDELLQLFYKRYKNTTEITSACSEYLSENDGKTLTLLLDGYDEYPSDLQKNSLIADIIKRRVFPLCGLVVSSRPHASELLRKQATIQVDILGFTETEREHYIKQALPDQPHKIKELTQYLQQQQSIDSICFNPFNMVILLYLYKLGILPKNSTELYHHFICSTICRHLYKFDNSLTQHITNLTNLPEPYKRVIQQLSKFSLEAINNNKLIFTLDEITAACPDIAAIPGAINGFGLLQAVQHFGLYAKTMTLNFIHFTIQEFLAAHYISHLPSNEEQLKVIEANFWNDIHFNMFSIYISLTKGQQSSFKTFLSGGNKAITIAEKFLKDQLKCLRLYRCFNEASDHKMCNTIERADIFHDRKINIQWTTLTGSDMECISLFLTSSFNKEWERIDLWDCYIQDKGLNILYRGLRHSSDIIINQLWLRYNCLATQSSYLISKLTVKCKVKHLRIDGNNTVGEAQQLYSMLTNPSSVLERLSMTATQLSSRAAIDLFSALKINNKLKKLLVDHNAITDDACDAITTALETNNCLVVLSIYDNPLSSEAIVNIVQCLEINNALQYLGLPECPQNIQENIISQQEVVTKKRESRGCQLKLEIKFW